MTSRQLETLYNLLSTYVEKQDALDWTADLLIQAVAADFATQAGGS